MIEIYKKFLKGFHRDDGVPFDCPECNKSTLFIDQDSWLQKERISSVLEREQNDFYEAEWVKYTYTGTLKCLNPKCGEVVITSGSGSVIEEYTDYCLDSDGYPGPCEREYKDIFFPKYFYPTLAFFDIPKKTPQCIKAVITEAFSLTPNSPSAAANKIRTAIEILATEFSIKPKTSKGDAISLHNRIKNMSPLNPLNNYKDSLLAIKYIGNAGSHEVDIVSFDELFDSYQIIEDLLKRIYPEENIINEIVRVINANEGPMTRAERRSIRTDK